MDWDKIALPPRRRILPSGWTRGGPYASYVRRCGKARVRPMTKDQWLAFVGKVGAVWK